MDRSIETTWQPGCSRRRRSVSRLDRSALPLLTFGATLVAAATALLAASGPVPAIAAPSDTTSITWFVPAHAEQRVDRTDLAFLAASAGAVAIAAHNDLWLTDETTEANSKVENRLANRVQPLGNGALVLPALAVTYGMARLTDHPEAARATMRIGASVGVTSVVTLALKEAVGRMRPTSSPNDIDELRPMTGQASFPSGHAAVAFAAATAIDRETSSRWVPWVAYPAAALIGWSRVHDRQHWTSDVVAGAAVGVWTAGKTETWMLARSHGTTPISVAFVPGPSGARIMVGF